jgi:hypothetical protein
VVGGHGGRPSDCFRVVWSLGCVEVGQNYQATRRSEPPRQTWAPGQSPGQGTDAPAVSNGGGWLVTGVDSIDSMILPQVHLG